MKQPVKIGNRDKSKTYHDYPLLIAYAIGFLPLVLMLVCAIMINVDAMQIGALDHYPDDFEFPIVDESVYPYYVWCSSEDYNFSDGGNKYVIHNYGTDFYSKYPVFSVRRESDGMHFLKAYNPSTQKTENVHYGLDHIFPISSYHTVKDMDGKQFVSQVFEGGATAAEPWYTTFKPYNQEGPIATYFKYGCNVYEFDSEESAIKYFRDGDGSGIVSRPPPDVDYDHDFREDVYDPDIPVPELSNLSYNGFHVNNADPSRDIEIYIETTFYGLKHRAMSNTVAPNITNPFNSALYFSPNESWAFGSHRYNLINTDISYSDADIDINKMFRVDISKDLIKDFKVWSDKYTSHKKLPDYSYFAHSAKEYTTYYNKCHLYSSSAGANDAAKLKITGQATVTYYVRFCQYIPSEGYTWGKWIAYSYTGRTSGVKDDVTIGDTGVDPDTGKPNVENPRPGTQDPTTGDVDYSGTSDMDASDLWATIKSLVNSMGAIPEIISEVLSFLPPWVLYMIAAGIAASVILRFVGR